MSYNVTFETGEIAAKAAAINQTAGEIDSLLATLTSQMADLAASYTGPAAAAFQEVYARWQTTQFQIKEELGEIGIALGNTGQAREEQEESLRGQWASAL